MIKVNCLQCNKETIRYKSTIRSKTFCSTKCRGDFNRSDVNFGSWNIGLVRSNEVKDKISKSNKGKLSGSKNPFWGKKHSEETLKKISTSRIGKMVGEKHFRYIKDRSKLKKDDRRNDYSYKEWRKQVWFRDNFSCRIADINCNGRIEAHHILAWSTYPELRYKTNNGITLCHAHHPRARAEEKRLIPTFQELVSVLN